MNSNIQQNNTENATIQEKPDTNLIQNEPDTNLDQNKVLTNPEEKQEDPNWRAFREARKKDRLKTEEAERKAAEKEAEVAALKAAMEAAFAKDQRNTQHTEQNYSNTYQEESEDDRIAKKVQAAIEQKEREYERQRQERERQEYPQRLQQQYSDFNQTISDENQDYLVFHHPEIAGPIRQMADGYEKWQYIYQAIKKHVPNNMTSKRDAQRADNNFNKPKSISSTGLTQTGESMGSARLTEERKAQNWERMQRMLRGVSS